MPVVESDKKYGPAKLFSPRTDIVKYRSESKLINIENIGKINADVIKDNIKKYNIL
jgi:hypothetical protein